MPTNTVRLHRVLRAAPERVYRAFLDADAMAKWLPPNGFTGKVHHPGRRDLPHVVHELHERAEPRVRREVSRTRAERTSSLYRRFRGPEPPGRDAAPTGKLRVGLVLGSPSSATKDASSGEMKGVGFDLGTELARRMGVPFEPVVYKSIGELAGSATSGQWDVTFLAASPERAKEMDFTAPHLELELGYLVPAGSPIAAFADVDRAGVRVAVPAKGQADVVLSETLKNATVVRGPGLPGALELLKSGKADAFGANKANLYAISDRMPGSRVLDGRFATEKQAMAMPKGRDAGAAYARRFIEDAKAEGLVAAAVERAGLRGVVAGP